MYFFFNFPNLLPLMVLLFFFLFLQVGNYNGVVLGYTSIIYNRGFKTANLILDGITTISDDGLLRLTNDTLQEKGHAFFPDPIPFKPSKNGSVLSFSTTFVFGIISEYPRLSGQGLVFVITLSRGLPNSLPKQHLGLFNETSNGKATNHVVGVELDTIQDPQFNDINNNHVGIDVNSLTSVVSKPAAYYINDTYNVSVPLFNNGEVQVWIEYDGPKMQMNVTLAPIKIEKPTIPLISFPLDLSPILNDNMYIGFSSSTGSMVTSHYVLGWSFALNETAQSLDIAALPKLPKTTTTAAKSGVSKKLIIAIFLSTIFVIIAVCFAIFYWIRRKDKFAEELEDWESEYGPHRFRYRDLYVATKGFGDRQLVGTGGFGRVYHGVLPKSETEVAVKRVSHDSRQGMKEFVAEIVTLGRLSHRNLVQLLGYCRRKGELLIVYEFMPNGSLDKRLHQRDNPELILNWNQRFNIIKGVASGLLYLHEEWEQVVVHRDIKASNVLLDSDLNGRLSDFGLARLHDRGTDPQTTHVMGTLGYLAPEHSRTGKATRRSDVFAFGAFLLEVVCGRRPIDLTAPRGESMLVDKVFRHWKSGEIVRVVDPIMKEYVEEEAIRVLKLGLICSNVDADERPSMRDVVAYLNDEGIVEIQDMEGLELGSAGVSYVKDWKKESPAWRQNLNDIPTSSYSSSGLNTVFQRSPSVAESQLSEGR